MLRRRLTSRVGAIRRRASAAKPSPVCPSCRSPIPPQEAFCTGCGTQIRDTAEQRIAKRRRRQAAAAKQTMVRKISNGRIWILVVSLLTLFGGLIQYGILQSEVEKGIAETNRNLSIMDDEGKAAFDEMFRAETGMKWDQAIRQARSEVNLLLVACLVMAAVYFGLYLWANRNPFPAAMIALLLFLAGIAVQFMIEPTLVMKGLILKILTIAGLGTAASAAHRYRRLYGNRPVV